MKDRDLVRSKNRECVYWVSYFIANHLLTFTLLLHANVKTCSDVRSVGGGTHGNGIQFSKTFQKHIHRVISV